MFQNISRDLNSDGNNYEENDKKVNIKDVIKIICKGKSSIICNNIFDINGRL